MTSRYVWSCTMSTDSTLQTVELRDTSDYRPVVNADVAVDFRRRMNELDNRTASARHWHDPHKLTRVSQNSRNRLYTRSTTRSICLPTSHATTRQCTNQLLQTEHQAAFLSGQASQSVQPFYTAHPSGQHIHTAQQGLPQTDP